MKTRVSLLLLFIFGMFAPQTARADSGQVEVYLQVKPADPTNPKERGKAPRVEATVVGGAKTTVDKYSLSTTVAGQKVTMKADKFRDYSEGTETIAIALVVAGQEVWIGNEDVEPDPNARYEGVLKNLESAIDKLQLGNAGPPGSKGVVISYSTGAEIKVPMGDLKNISGGALGSQKDYQHKIGTDLVSGITLGMAELQKVSTPRKALIVVGDGTDTAPDAAKGQLAQLKKDAAAAKINTFAIIYRGAVTGDSPTVVTTMIPGAKTVNSVDGIATELNAIITRMGDRFYLEFPGYDPKLKQGLPWDGKDHDVVLKNDQTEYEPITLQLAPKWSAPTEGGFPWLILIGVLVGVLLLIIIGVKVFSAKPVEGPAMAMPMPMPMPMPGAPAPPKPMGPVKTVMFNVNASDDGFPIVGWLVAMNGQDAYKTQRLKPGLTKIGTAPPADIVVNDGFMSTDHCAIQCSPAGFTLIDNGATNGSYVNDHKVQKHELVDNDMITLGKTNFKFKSIN
jgi:hypothetical protein